MDARHCEGLLTSCQDDESRARQGARCACCCCGFATHSPRWQGGSPPDPTRLLPFCSLAAQNVPCLPACHKSQDCAHCRKKGDRRHSHASSHPARTADTELCMLCALQLPPPPFLCTSLHYSSLTPPFSQTFSYTQQPSPDGGIHTRRHAAETFSLHHPDFARHYYLRRSIWALGSGGATDALQRAKA